MSFTKLDYCQYLLSSQVNYTLTNLAEHLKSFSHDTINRYLKSEKLSPRLLWKQTQPLLELDPEAYLIFDDTADAYPPIRRARIWVGRRAVCS